MPLHTETDHNGYNVRKFYVVSTRDRRRDKAIRATLRLYKVVPKPELYERVWNAAVGVDDPEAVALMYLAEVAREAMNRAFGNRPEALERAARQIAGAQKRLAPAGAKPTLALPPAAEPQQGV